MPTVAWYDVGNWEFTILHNIELLPTDCMPTSMTLNAFIEIYWFVSSIDIVLKYKLISYETN